MSLKLAFSLLAIHLVLINFPFTNASAKDADCGFISEIWESGQPKQESKLLQVYRRGKPLRAKVGMELEKNDRIQAKHPEVGFEITRRAENNDKKPAKKDTFLATAPDQRPFHITVKDCGKNTVYDVFANIIAIIKSGWPFKIETEPAIAGAPGTTFRIKQLNNGNAVKLMVTKGEAYLRNEYGSVTVKESEEGTAIKGSPPKKEKIKKDYIETELAWAFKGRDLPLLYAQEFKNFWIVKEAGVTDNEIRLGITTSITGRYAAWGKGISEIGAITYFDQINRQGGINGRKIKTIIMDDAYNPGLAIANVQKLIFKEKVFCLFSPFGTAITMGLIPVVGMHKIPLFSPMTLSPAIVQRFSPYVFNLYPDYHTQAEQIVNYLVSINKRRITIAYTDNAYGKDGLKGTEAALEKKGLELIAAVPIIPKDMRIDLTPQITKLKRGEADTVILFTLPRQAANFLMQSRSWRPLFIGPSRIATRKLIETAGLAAEGVIALRITPDPKTSRRQGVVRYRELLKKYFPKEQPSQASLLGYTSADVFVEGLRKPGRTLTRELFIKSLETMKGYETGIIPPVTFSQKTHLATRRVYFNKVIEGKFTEFEVP